MADVPRGESPTVVARISDVAARSVFEWPAWSRKAGWDRLREGRWSGRPTTVTGPIKQWLHLVVTLGDPVNTVWNQAKARLGKLFSQLEGSNEHRRAGGDAIDSDES